MKVFLPPVATFLIGLLYIGTPVKGADPDSRPMNVLFVSIDDLRVEVGAYGVERAITPHLDRLASESVLFERAYAQYPLCNPSRVSALTGRYPRTSELYGNRDWFNAWYPDWVSLPKHFKQNGYTTIRSGKIFHGSLIDDWKAWTIGGVPHEFDDPKPASVVADTAISTEAEKARIARMLEGGMGRRARSDRWEAVDDPERIASMGDTLAADRAIEHLKRWKEGDPPFFIGFGLVKPHSPLVAPKRFFDLYEADAIELPPDFAPRPTVPEGFPWASIRPRNADLFVRRDASEREAREMIRAYLACTSYTDWNFGRVLNALDELGLRDSTIIVVWSDHGYQLGEKGKWSKAGSLWEQGVRVPLIIHDPRIATPGASSPRVVELLDLYPTLVELCGLPMPEGLEGDSLVPLLEDPDREWDRPAFSVWSERNRGISGAVVRTERWRYAEFFGPGAGAFLTDPIHDPYETENLVNDPRYADVVARLSKTLREHVAGKTEPTE